MKNSKGHIADTDKENKLRACLTCKLLLSINQWEKRRYNCVNCPPPVDHFVNESDRITPNYTGIISLVLPSSSWVAKYNDLHGC